MVRTGFVRSAGLGYQENRTKWANGGWVEPDSYRPTSSQLMGLRRRAGDRLEARPNVDREVRRMENRWDTPRKCNNLSLSHTLDAEGGCEIFIVYVQKHPVKDK